MARRLIVRRRKTLPYGGRGGAYLTDARPTVPAYSYRCPLCKATRARTRHVVTYCETCRCRMIEATA